MKNRHTSCIFHELSEWHREVLSRLLNAPFSGQPELKAQVLAARFRVIDDNQSLEIIPTSSVPAPIIKTVPVWVSAADEDGVPIELLLFTRHGSAYMLEVLRADGEQVKRLPPGISLKIMVLGV